MSNFLSPLSYLPLCGCCTCQEDCLKEVHSVRKNIYSCVTWSLCGISTISAACAAFGIATLTNRVTAEASFLTAVGTVIFVITCLGACCLYQNRDSLLIRETNRAIAKNAKAVQNLADENQKIEENTIELQEMGNKLASELSSIKEKLPQAESVEELRKDMHTFSTNFDTFLTKVKKGEDLADKLNIESKEMKETVETLNEVIAPPNSNNSTLKVRNPDSNLEELEKKLNIPPKRENRNKNEGQAD